MKKRVKYLTKVSQIEQLSNEEKEALKEVEKKYIFRSNDYYNSLIDWNDPNDPLRRLVIPSLSELEEWGSLDASNEQKYTVAKGLEHKYKDTALILFNDICGAYCRYCFRKRLFIKGNDDTVRDLKEAVEYIKNHKEIQNVLITGGDPLVASTSKIEPLIKSLREIDHVGVIRIGTKMLSFNPYRVLDDEKFIEMLKKYSLPSKRIYIMAHFSHPKELTPQAIEAVDLILKAGAIINNQTPMIKGVNDSVEVMTQLFKKLVEIGVSPYYIFACRPTAGNKDYAVEIERAYEIFNEARCNVAGIASRAKFVMSHESGKVEVLGMDSDNIYFRYHRAAKESDCGKLLKYKRGKNAFWFDDYLKQEEK